jgi:hypothetical protein
METRKFVQFGTFSVAMASSLLVIFLILTFSIGMKDILYLITFGITSLIMLFLLLCFYQMVIEVNQTYLSFSMGIGLFRGQYRIENLKECRPVVNSWINGIGMRMISHGWLYNVSGYKAVELTFKDSDRVIRLGTNQPEEIAKIVMGYLHKEHEPVDYTVTRRSYSPSKNQYLMVVAVFAIIFLFTLYGNQDAKITVKNDSFVIEGMYGGTISFANISQLDTVTWMPAIQMRTNGYGFGKICKGNFRLKDEGNAKLFVNCGSSPFIRLKLKSEKLYYFNFKERQKTIELFERLREKAK